MKLRLCGIITFGLACTLIAVFAYAPERFIGGPEVVQRVQGKATVPDRVAQFGPRARKRWQPYFEKAGISYPPQRILLLGLKQEKRLEVYAADAGEPFKLVRSFSIQRASGKIGPKLRYGDLQVPEGFYRIESLNPNSAFHLALRVNYPSAFDRSQAKREGRTELGGDIMIHGSNVSIGCLAMGDEGAEDLFILAAEVGVENIEVIFCPVDFRVSDVPDDNNRPKWVSELYKDIRKAVRKLPTAEGRTSAD